MLCSRCKKRQAVVFISTIQGNEKRDEGLCLICAKELGVPQVNDYLEKMGISDEDLEESYKMLFGEGDPDSEENDEDFTPGGAGTMMPQIRTESPKAKSRRSRTRRSTIRKKRRRRENFSMLTALTLPPKPKRARLTA